MTGRRTGGANARRYPRTARLNEVLREILADALEHIADDDDRLDLTTVTGVEVEPGLRHATVYYSARHDHADEALMEQRVHLQAEIARQARLKRTPQLSFVVDPGVTSGWRIEEVLKGLHPDGGPRGQDEAGD